jgi:DNA-damage-inducible protein D
MEAEIIRSLAKNFESSAYMHEGVECWNARDLQRLLGYARWENFENAIKKAKQSCINAGFPIDNQFRDFTKMVEIGLEAKRATADIRLTRYACYLIAQNGNPNIAEIAFAQTYFAVQTRKVEVLEQRIGQVERLIARGKLKETENKFSGLIYERDVDEMGFSVIRSKGDKALFGKTTQEMKDKLGIKAGPLADHLPAITIKAKDLATEITVHKLQNNDSIRGQTPIEGEHIKSNQEMRKMLVGQGVIPENLPKEEDLKKIDRQIKSDGKRLAKDQAKKLHPNPQKLDD